MTTVSRYQTLVGVVVGLNFACSVKDPLFCNTDADCQDVTGRPFCDLTGQYEANNISHTCVAGPDAGIVADASIADGPVSGPDSAPVCAPNTHGCEAGLYSNCGPDGQWASRLECGPLGCNSSGTACLDIQPLNNLGSQLDLSPAAPVLSTTVTLTIDTDTGNIIDSTGLSLPIPSSVVSQGAGLPDIRVFRVKSMSIGSASVKGGLALAFVSDGDVKLNGVIDASASSGLFGTATSGPGSLPGGNACTGAPGTGKGGGGGGGAWYSGGKGGNAGSSGAGAGGTGGQTAKGAPLVGGCGGGRGLSASPGAGGGAVQIVSRTSIALVGTAAIDTSGSGGYGATAGALSGGGGGGSGGVILLEAPALDLSSYDSVISTRGGGGGASTSQNGSVAGGQGADGDTNPGTAQPAGGACSGDCATGGLGGQIRWSTGTILFDGVGTGAAGTAAGGGGGGSCGTAVFRTATGTATISAKVRSGGWLLPIATRDRTK